MPPTLPEQLPPTPRFSNGMQIFLGIIVGILQIVVVLYLINSINFLALGNAINYGGLWAFLYLVALLLPLFLEGFVLGKEYPSFFKGVIIGTILTPLIGVGLCFYALSRANF